MVYLLDQRCMESTVWERGNRRLFCTYLGKEYSEEEVKRAIATFYHGKYRKSDNAVKEAAVFLSKNMIVGWFCGKSEFGPRALGHRSIIANPCNRDMKDILNRRVKFREDFRPFAPIFLYEETDKWFGEKIDNPYMLIVKEVLPEVREQIPAVVHVDNTARLQSVKREQNPKVYDLIVEFGKITGVSVILNTSFNVKGEPIVESPEDAIWCFLKTDIDVLVLEDYILEK